MLCRHAPWWIALVTRRISTRSGIGLGFSGGLDFARTLIGEGKKVFLDFKLHDIGNTVSEGVGGSRVARG